MHRQPSRSRHARAAQWHEAYSWLLANSCMHVAAPAQGPGKPMPEGFRFRKVYSAAKPGGYGEYVADNCPIHGASKRLDRWKAVVDFFTAHSHCK